MRRNTVLSYHGKTFYIDRKSDNRSYLATFTIDGLDKFLNRIVADTTKLKKINENEYIIFKKTYFLKVDFSSKNEPTVRLSYIDNLI